jgi:hypothetical protein
MYVYSSSTRGWANLAGDQDPRPAQLQADRPGTLSCVASTLRAERTGAGEETAKVAGRSAAGFAQAMTATACRPSLCSGIALAEHQLGTWPQDVVSICNVNARESALHGCHAF